MAPNFHKAIRIIQLSVDETGDIFSEKLKAFTLELVDFKDKPEAYPKSQIEYWLYNLANMESMTEALPFQTQQPIFSKMGGISELSHMSSEERRKYFNSLNKYRTNLSVVENAIDEGRNERTIEIAANLKSLDVSIDKIVQATGLSISEIESL